MKSKKLRIGSILLAMVIFAGTMTGIAFAGTDQSTNSDKPDKPDMTAMTAMYDSFISKFATNLGVTQDQVTAALKATQLEMIDDAVEDGTLTQEQADQMTERIESGEGSGIIGFGMGRGGPGGNGKAPGANTDNATN